MRHRQPRSPPRPPRISRHWNRPVPRNALPRTEESRRVTRATPVRPRRHALVSTQPSVRRGRVHVRGLRISADGTRRAAIPPQPPETSRTERLFRVRILAWPCRTTCPVSIVDARPGEGHRDRSSRRVPIRSANGPAARRVPIFCFRRRESARPVRRAPYDPDIHGPRHARAVASRWIQSPRDVRGHECEKRIPARVAEHVSHHGGRAREVNLKYVPAGCAASSEEMMARLHAHRKGKSGSTRPFLKANPEWVAMEKADIEETIFRLHQEGLSAAAIGVRLRDGFGVPSVRLATGRSLLEILRSKGAKFALPEDLAGLIRGAAGLVDRVSRVRVFCHYDPDGTTSASILTRALMRRGKRIHATMAHALDRSSAARLNEETNELLIVSDMGSAQLDLLEGLSYPVIVLDHHKPIRDSDKVAHVNPHFEGVDGAREMCGATTTWLFTLVLDEANWDL